MQDDRAPHGGGPVDGTHAAPTADDDATSDGDALPGDPSGPTGDADTPAPPTDALPADAEVTPPPPDPQPSDADPGADAEPRADADLPPDGDPSSPPGDSDPPPDNDPPPGDAGSDPTPTYPRQCADIYDQGLLPTFALEIADTEWQALQVEFATGNAREDEGLDPKPYHPAVFRYGDEVVSDAMVRLKGNPCCSWEPPKMQFVIAFNQVNAKGRFHGLRKIALDAPPYDPSLLRERIALAYMRQLGVNAPCANNARLVVNGQYYGLFVNVEFVDKEFLQRNFAAHDGDLYKAGHDLKTNETTSDGSRMRAFWAAGDYATVDALADLDEMVLEWAAEGVLPDGDGFFAGGVNFYLYDHPERGFLVLPWDVDQSFAIAPTGVDPLTFYAAWSAPPASFTIVTTDPDGRARYMRALRQALAAYHPAELRGWLDAWNAQIATAIAQDPNLHTTIEYRTWDVENLRAYFEQRRVFVEGWLELNDPAGAP